MACVYDACHKVQVFGFDKKISANVKKTMALCCSFWQENQIGLIEIKVLLYNPQMHFPG